MSADALFRPYSFKGLKLKNRIVMAPMTRSFSPGGVATEDVAQYYRRRAEADVGLIISEGTGVNRPASLNDKNVPRFHGEKELAAWKRVIDEVHAVGGVMAPQLWHVGAVRTRDPEWAPPGPYDSPSGLSRPGKEFGKGMTEEEVADTIAAFAQAAADAKALGFDAIELHGAHGYLIDQFFWDGTNAREDAYGAKDLPGRARFAADILRAVRQAVGPDYPVIIRISRFWEPEFEGSDLNFAGWAKKLTGVPTITVGSVGLSGEFIAAFAGEGSQPASLDRLLERLERDEFDLVGVGRALLQDPEWARKVKEGRTEELAPFERSAMAKLY